MTQRVVVRTRLRAGREADYDRLHEQIPADLATALREHGVRDWSIWRDGRDLFHLIECDDYAVMRRGLADHPANTPWQARMADLLEVEDDYSGKGSGLPLVWRLSAQ